MKVFTSDRNVLGGADGLLYICGRIWWGYPLIGFSKLPGGIKLLRFIYASIAARRHCAYGRCQVKGHSCVVGLFPLFSIPPAVYYFLRHTEPWILMWCMSFALFMCCKWLTYWMAKSKKKIGLKPSLLYLFFWPGMNARTFFSQDPPHLVSIHDWKTGFMNLMFGAFCLWGLARTIPSAHPIVQGWIGMFGVVFILHFGVFKLLSCAFSRGGFQAEALMKMPIASRSLAEFWGARWNTAFRDLAFDFVFAPIRKYVGSRMAMLLVFLVSGVVHELVITLPARSGWGLPTLYFVLQAVGILLEREVFRHRLKNSIAGWWFTFLFAGIPALLLFPPAFIHTVIIPFLERIGAL